MIYIVNINSQRFTLNGISYYKNFLSHVIGENIRIVNAYDSKLEILRLTHYSEIRVGGRSFGSVEALQMALLPVLYVRGTLGNGSGADNGILQIGDIEIIQEGGQKKLKINYPPTSIWRIGGVEYSKDAETKITIPPAETGKYRIDIIGANTANDFERFVGEESPDVGVPPQLPSDVIPVTEVNIFGDQIGDPSAPGGDGFITKSSKQYRGIAIINSDPIEIAFSPERTSFLVKSGEGIHGVIKGFIGFIGVSSVGFEYDGLDLYVQNAGKEDLTLLDRSDAVVPFNFPKGNLSISTGETVHLKYNRSKNIIQLVGLLSGSSGGSETPALQQVLQKGNYAGEMKITGLSEGTQPGDAIIFEQINIDENINPLQTYNTAAGN